MPGRGNFSGPHIDIIVFAEMNVPTPKVRDTSAALNR